MDAPRRYSRQSKYETTAEMLSGKRGTLLDIGARDRALRQFLNLENIRYHSADLGVGHDYVVNLEEKLPLPDCSFDFVVALDVLEHLEHIHEAFDELARITRQELIIALPNVATLIRRWSFLLKGNLSTGKYDLLPEHQGDRHRWVTIYPEMNRFIVSSADRNDLVVEQIIEEPEPNRIIQGIAGLSNLLGIRPNGLFSERCIYSLSRRKNQ